VSTLILSTFATLLTEHKSFRFLKSLLIGSMFPPVSAITWTVTFLCIVGVVCGNLIFLASNLSMPIVQLIYAGTPLNVGLIGQMIPESPSANYSGKVVLVVEVVPIEPKWREIQARGAIAGVTGASPGITPGRIEFWSDGSNTSDIKILTGELRWEDFLTANTTLWNSSTIDNATGLPTVAVEINGWTTNPWDILQSPGFIVWDVLLLAMHVAALVYTLVKFGLLVRHDGRVRLSVAQMICIVETIGLLIRIVYLSVDPLGSRKIVPYRGSEILITLSFPFGIASNLLILFYWQELLSKRNMKVSPFLKRLVVPFIIFVILLILLDLAGGITRGFDLVLYFPTIVLVNAAFYAGTLFALAVWIFVIAGRVFQRFKKSQKATSKVDRLLLRTSVIITISGCISVMLTALFILIFFDNIFWVPVGMSCHPHLNIVSLLGNVLIWFFLYALFTARGYLQVFLIQIPKDGSH